jgi:hypothetical protein
MGRHVNHHDEQDRWIRKAEKINRNQRNLSLEERDPATLSIKEQEELIRKRHILEKERGVIKKEQEDKLRERHNFTHYRPKENK